MNNNINQFASAWQLPGVRILAKNLFSCRLVTNELIPFPLPDVYPLMLRVSQFGRKTLFSIHTIFRVMVAHNGVLD